ncbi:MAG: M14 family zinc carboxypeptidase [Candidatus Heimdallarchaeota archaeon]
MNWISKFTALWLFLFFFYPPSDIATISPALTPICVRIDTPPVNRTWGYIPLLYEDQFHDPIEIQAEIDRMHELAPELIDLETVGQSYQGRNITSVRITNELNTAQKAKTLVVAHHHGREQITVETALRFILRLVNGYGYNQEITHWIDNEEVYVIPTLNPDALDLVVNNGSHWLRKNLRPFDNDNDTLYDEDPAEDVDGDGHISEYRVSSKLNSSESYNYLEGIDNDGDGRINEDGVGLVDLNRNYATFWRYRPGYDTQTYAGTEPFSEPETQTFRQFARNHKFAMAYSLHSGINATWFARGEEDQYPYLQLYTEMSRDFQTLLPSSFIQGPVPNLQANEISASNEAVNQESSNIPTAVGGLWKEWMVFDQGCIAPLTFEIYHNASVDGSGASSVLVDNSTHLITQWKGIFGYFNPEVRFIDDLWRDILPAFDYLLDVTPRLNIDTESDSAENDQRDRATFRFSFRNLSPRLGTVDQIAFLGADGRILVKRQPLGAGENRTEAFGLVLSPDTSGEGYTISIGNNYTGYTRFVISFSASPADSSSPAFEFGILLAILPWFVFYKKCFSKEENKSS